MGMTSGFVSATRTALAWFSLGYLLATSNGPEGEHFASNWRRGLNEEHLEHVEHGSDEVEESEEERDAFVDVTTVAVTVLVLILFTILFEWAKDNIEEGAPRDMKPIVEALFGEMTVLGFLSVLTFLITQTGGFTALSKRIFGEHEEDGLLEIFESAHFCLFFVMIFFLIQVLILLKKASRIEKNWIYMEAKCQDKEYMSKIRAGDFTAHDNKTREILVFASIRDEFIKNRSLEPPFLPSEGEDRIPDDFNFGRYLSICLGHSIAHTVDVDIVTWVFFALFTVVFYGIWLLTKFNLVILGWIWVALPYLLLLLGNHTLNHLIEVRDSFAAVPSDHNETNQEEGYLLAEKGQETLPKWCSMDMGTYLSKRSLLSRMLNKKRAPTRQEALFWLEKKGPKLNLLLFQGALIFFSVYCALLILIFLPAMYKEGLGWFIPYIIVALIPIFVKEVRSSGRFAVISQVSCIGALRRPQVITTVIREDKTEDIVRGFLVICLMHRAAEAGFPEPKKTGGRGDFHHTSFSSAMKKDIEHTFNCFDESGDGYIETDELGTLMTNIGTPLSGEKLQGMMTALDENKDGKVSKEEFIHWYVDQISGDQSMTMEELVPVVFGMFDEDGTGEVTISEFMAKLEAFNVDFTVDEIGELVKELDEDNSGRIELKEFEELVERHYPRELHHH